MTITPDEHPRLNASERSTYQALIDQLEPNDLVIPGQRVTDHLKDHEVDFVVAIEGAGIVCLEVKAGRSGTTARRGGRSAPGTSTRSTRSGRLGTPVTRCATSSKKTIAGAKAGCVGITSSFCPTPRSPTTSPCRNVRGGRSSTATTFRRSSTSSSTSSSGRSSTVRC